MESPQTRLSSPAAGEPGRLFMRPKPGGAARRALPALHNYGVAWQHPSPTAGHALCSEAPIPKSFPCVSILMRASPPFTESCLVWSECTWERFTDTLAVRSTAWRCVRSTRPEDPATSFAFLQPLPSTRFQPITETTESFEGGTNAVKVVRRVKAIVNSCVCVNSTSKVMFCPKRKHKRGYALDGILRLKTQH